MAGIAQTCILADDDSHFRTLLRQGAINAGLEVAAEAKDGEEALALLRQHNPTIALVDILMPGINGIEVCVHVRAERLSTKIVLMTGFDRQDFAIHAMDAGADGYVMKTDDIVGNLCGIVDALSVGCPYVSPQPLRFLLEDYRRLRIAERTQGRLTAAQVQLLTLIANGRVNKEIADEMNISVRTVENRRAKLAKQVGAGSVAELVRCAAKFGLIAL